MQYRNQKNNKSGLVKYLYNGFVIGCVVFLVEVLVRWLSGRPFSFEPYLLEVFGYHQVYAIVLTLVNFGFFDVLDTRFNWKGTGKRRLWVGAIGSVLLTVLGVFVIRLNLEMVVEGEDWKTFIKGEQLLIYLVTLLIAIVVSITYHAIYFYKHWQEKKVTEQKIIAGTASAKFDALKNQLDPHFLFNSLNVLTSLIDEDPDQAQKFTTSLSKVYRYVLEQKNKDLVSVDEELAFARTYVRLLKMRFEDSIVFDIPDAAQNTEAKLVPLSLQLLLENAVKHNVVTQTRPLKVKVYEDQGNLIVTNNLQEKEVVKKSSGVGLRNIVQRYNLLTDREVRILKSAADFSVSLPLLTKKIEVMEPVQQQTYIEDKRYEKARERVEAMKGFYGNLTAYCIVIPCLALLNYNTTSFPWVIFPTMGWGLGLLFHGMEAFGYNPFFGKGWEERKIREFMDQDNTK
jgi:hypothetical protein